MAIAGSTLVGQPNIVVPNDLADREGLGAGSLPFWSFETSVSVRVQQVFEASEFSAISQSGWIERISIRSSSEGMSGSAFIANLSQFQINFSTTSRGPDNLSPVFAENIGADETVAYGPGSSLYISTIYNRAQQPQLFASPIFLQRPFFYNPAAGNLLLDIRNWQTVVAPVPGSPRLPWIDGESVLGDSVSRVWSRDVSATEGTPDTFGFVFQFVITPIPEPSSLCLLELCALACGVGWAHSRARNQPDTKEDQR